MDEVNSQPNQVKEVLQRVAHCNGRVRMNYTGRQFKGQGVQGAGSASQVTDSARGRECKPGDTQCKGQEVQAR